MDEKELIKWGMGILGTLLVSAIVAVFKWGQAVGTRITRIEAVLSLWSESMARVLHSPHTPELDKLLEKYLNRHYELSNDEWTRLRELCNEIEANKDEGKESRALAGFLAVVAEHKLAMPPRKMMGHEEAGTG